MAKKSNLVLQEPWWMRTPLPSVFFIIILVFVVVVLFISLSYDKVEYLSPKIFDRQQVNLMSVSADETRKQKCDLFSGRWVYDYSTQPLYSGVGCSYMNDEVACEKFGRKDLEHQRWRWQPHGCRVPRYAYCLAMLADLLVTAFAFEGRSHIFLHFFFFFFLPASFPM